NAVDREDALAIQQYAPRPLRARVAERHARARASDAVSTDALREGTACEPSFFCPASDERAGVPSQPFVTPAYAGVQNLDSTGPPPSRGRRIQYPAMTLRSTRGSRGDEFWTGTLSDDDGAGDAGGAYAGARRRGRHSRTRRWPQAGRSSRSHSRSHSPCRTPEPRRSRRAPASQAR